MIGNTDQRVDKLDPVQVAMAALCEAGRPDLAMQVRPNKKGWPSLKDAVPEDREVIARAFFFAHKSTGHDCELIQDLTAFGSGWGWGTHCHTCWHYLKEHGEFLAAP